MLHALGVVFEPVRIKEACVFAAWPIRNDVLGSTFWSLEFASSTHDREGTLPAASFECDEWVTKKEFFDMRK